MSDKVPFSGILTTFDAYIIPYHNEDISGFILRSSVQIHQGSIKSFLPSSANRLLVYIMYL